MFARANRRGFVCLQCQLRIARRDALRPPIFLRRTYSDSSSPATDLDDETTAGAGTVVHFNASSRPHERGARRESSNETTAQLRSEFDAGSGRPKVRFVAHEKNSPGKRHGRENRDRTVALPMNRLGKPADVLVLEETVDEPNQDSRKARKGSNPPDTHTVSAEEIIASIKEQKRNASPAEINRMIDSLRPASSLESTVIPRREYERIHQLLFEGYTTDQLNVYTAYAKKTIKSKGQAVNVRQRAFEVSEWTSGNGSATTNPAQNQANSVKEKKISHIIRKCWDVEVLEEIECLGHLLVKAKERTFTLLTVGCTYTVSR
jgi:hypothetical protein